MSESENLEDDCGCTGIEHCRYMGALLDEAKAKVVALEAASAKANRRLLNRACEVGTLRSQRDTARAEVERLKASEQEEAIKALRYMETCTKHEVTIAALEAESKANLREWKKAEAKVERLRRKIRLALASYSSPKHGPNSQLFDARMADLKEAAGE